MSCSPAPLETAVSTIVMGMLAPSALSNISMQTTRHGHWPNLEPAIQFCLVSEINKVMIYKKELTHKKEK